MTSLESQSQKRWLSRFLLLSWKEGLLPLPEGTCLSSLSPPPCLLRISHTPLDLPHPATMPITETMERDSTWAMMYESSLPTPLTTLGISTLQYPRPQLAQASSGTILPFHTAPISQPLVTAHPIIEPLLQQPTDKSGGLPQSGTSLYRTRSTHSSLYKQLRNPSPAPPRPLNAHPGATTGRASVSSLRHYHDLGIIPLEQQPGNDSPGNSESSCNLHQSYLRPLSCSMDDSPVRQAAQTPFSNTPAPHPIPLPHSQWNSIVPRADTPAKPPRFPQQ